MKQLMRHVQIVSERARQQEKADVLAWTERRCLAQLVTEVHKAGMVGTSWPRVAREPMVRRPDMSLRPADIAHGETPHEWRIEAAVVAEPKPGTVEHG